MIEENECSEEVGDGIDHDYVKNKVTGTEDNELRQIGEEAAEEEGSSSDQQEYNQVEVKER